MILDSASRNAGTREEGEPGSQCCSRHALLRVRTLLFSLLRRGGLNIWGFLHTHKTAMVGNVLTPGGLLLRLTEFILPPPHPSVKESDPRADSYDQIGGLARPAEQRKA